MHTKRPTVKAAEEILDRYFPVLDHGFVSLVDYMGGDAEIARAARVSYGKTGLGNEQEDRGLLRYMMRHKHTSPFEMCELKFHCSMPIFVARQWIRHRTANVNEISGRYSVLPMQFYMPPQDRLQTQSQTNKQGSSTTVISDGKRMQKKWEAHRNDTKELYGDLLAEDLAKELARIDLPLSTYTQWYWKIDLHNLFHFLALRVDSHAQFEIRQYGLVIAGIVKRMAPISFQAWLDYMVNSYTFSAMEMECLRGITGLMNDELMTEKSSSFLMNKGASKREVTEFNKAIFDKEEISADKFDLDIKKSRSSQFFQKKADKYRLEGAK